MVAFASPKRKHQSYDLRLLEKLTFVRKQADSSASDHRLPSAKLRAGDSNAQPDLRRFKPPGDR